MEMAVAQLCAFAAFICFKVAWEEGCSFTRWLFFEAQGVLFAAQAFALFVVAVDPYVKGLS